MTVDGAGLVDAPVAGDAGLAHHGVQLTREAAFADPRLPGLWPVIDQVLVSVAEVGDVIYGEGRP